MASFVTNIRVKNYQNLMIGFQVTVENVGDVFLGTQCRVKLRAVFIQLLVSSCCANLDVTRCMKYYLCFGNFVVNVEKEAMTTSMS